MLELQNISYAIGNKPILRQVNARFQPGKVTMVLGPNGSGKSSLLRIFSGEHRAFEGDVLVDGKSLRNIPPLEYARFRAVLSQQPHLQFPLSVEEVVLMGRYPFFSSQPSAHDKRICDEAIASLHLDNFRKRDYLTLSGGEKQRVQYARILAQVWEQPAQGNRYLFLDEPLNSLDIKYQQEFLQTAKGLLNEQTVVVVIIHDINLALKFGDEFLFLKNGEVVAQGDKTIITPSLISNVFGVASSVANLDGQSVVIIH